MNNSKFLLFLTFLFITVFSKGQNINYDFNLINNSIVVGHNINDKKFSLLFDTGSNTTILDSAKVGQAKVCIKKEPFEITILSGLIKVYNIDYYNAMFPLLVATPKILAKGEIDGIFGASKLVQDYIIKIDFNNKKIYVLKENFNEDISKYIELELVPSSNDSIPNFLFEKFPAIDGSIIVSKKNYPVRFIIDTGCRYENVLLVKDSLLIKELSSEKKIYTSMFSKGRILHNSNISFNILGVEDVYSTEAYIFKDDLKELSIMGTKPIGVLLGVPFFKRFESVIIDWPKRKLYLKKDL